MADTSAYRPQRPRTSSMLSWGSHKSRESGGKMDLAESEKDKAQRRITGKADPSVAINELQPAMQALEKSTLAPLRTMQFKDHRGDPITDPDRSNPTRPRMERPLDTIRSFEAAIDSGYNRRYSAKPGNSVLSYSLDPRSDALNANTEEYHGKRMFAAEHLARSRARLDFAAEGKEPGTKTPSSNSSLSVKTNESPVHRHGSLRQDAYPELYEEPLLTYTENEDMQSRRSSFYQNFNNTPRTPGASSNPYFDRTPGSRPESVYDQQPPQSAGAYGGYPGSPQGAGYQQQRRMAPHGRMNSEPVYSSHPHAGANSTSPYQQGYETATASSSGTYQTEHGTGSTDPSSYNGSSGEINQVNSYAKPQPPIPQDRYGVDFGTEMEDEYGQPLNAYQQPPAQGYAANGMPAHGGNYGNRADMGSAMPPPPPPHLKNGARKPVGVRNDGYGRPAHNRYDSAPTSSSERPKPEKRKSWLSRRFSKHG